MKYQRVMSFLSVVVLMAVSLPVKGMISGTGGGEDGFSLPVGKAGVAYEYKIHAEGGLAPLKWKVAAGQLPPGLELLSSGIIRGVPTTAQAQPFVFEVEVSDASQPPQTFAQTLAVMIKAAPLRIVTNPTSLRIVQPTESRAVSPLAPPAESTPGLAGQPSARVASDREVNDGETGSAPATPAPKGKQADGSAGATAAESNESDAEKMIENTDYSWGRVRAYFTGAMVLSRERDDFSKQDLAVGFNLDKNYFQNRFFKINTFFDTRLTAIPVSAQDTATATDTTTPPPTDSEKEEDKFATFLASKKAVIMQVGAYFPLGVTNWCFQEEPNQLFIAPIAKGGIQSITNGFKTAEAKRVGDDNVFNFYSFGVRLGHYKYEREKTTKNKIGCGKLLAKKPTRDAAEELMTMSRDVAPELISYIDITRGRWENFEILKPVRDAAGNVILDPTKDDPTNPLTVRLRKYRWSAEGRLKIPNLPFIVGFDGNFGDGPDDLRFLFGVRFDVGKLFTKLKVLEAIGIKDAAEQKAAEAEKK